ncbi:MAG TPA: NADH-quinone oxidoreductase subunit M [Nitrospiria bacterium]|nr:NADH-quinone oxidoreductase subunit M [Nitrospiria bacterium]
MTDYILSIILFTPFIGVVLLFFVPNEKPLAVRIVAALAGLIPMIASFYLLYAYDSTVGGYQFTEQYVWAPNLGISLFLGVDGISIPLVLASSILLFTGIFVSWHVEDRAKEFFIFILILAAATIGVYVSLDLFFLYFFYEMSVLPMYVLIAIWGSHTKGYLEMTDTKKRDSPGFIFNFASNSKEYAAMKLTLFLSAGAVLALVAILIIYSTSGLYTFNIVELEQAGKIPEYLHGILFLLIFFGFASIAPLWPLHSWSPVGHASAPAAVSMLHAGVLMKLGHFSIIRVGYTLLPEATATWMPLAAILCVFSIIYGGWVAFFQKDTKYVIGYSSSSHMGYVFLGMAALNVISLTGAVLYMFAHALATGMLFAIAGYVYDQTHTRDIPSLGGLARKMPFISAVFVIAVGASFGLPLTVNFIGELMILVGSWEMYPVQTIIAVLGIGVTLAYLFKMMRGVFYGEMNPAYAHVKDASPFVDRLPLIVMAVISIFYGIFPGHFIEVIKAGVTPLINRINDVQKIAQGGGLF